MKKIIICLGLLISSVSFAQAMGSEGGGGTPNYYYFYKITFNRSMINNPQLDAAKSIVMALIGRSISIGEITGYKAKVENGKVVFCIDMNGTGVNAFYTFLKGAYQTSYDELNPGTPLTTVEGLEKSCI